MLEGIYFALLPLPKSENRGKLVNKGSDKVFAADSYVLLETWVVITWLSRPLNSQIQPKEEVFPPAY
jgi:hypothetical protein